MATMGLVFLVVAFAASIAAVALLAAGHFAKRSAITRIGRVAVAASAVALLV